MGLETGVYISDLIPSNPPGSDLRKQGDDHLRLIKAVLQGSFPNSFKAFYIPTAVSKTALYTILASEQNKLFFCDTSASAYTITLPILAVNDAGWSCMLFKSTSDVNVLTVMPASGTINSVASLKLRTINDLCTVYWTGTIWQAEIETKLTKLAVAVGGTVDAITVTMGSPTTGWVTGELFDWISGGANITATPTINKDGFGAKTIVSAAGSALNVGATGISGVRNTGYYDGLNVRLVGNGGAQVQLYSPIALSAVTSVDFTSIPSWAKEIDIILDNISTNGASPVQVQIGPAGGIETTGYVSTSISPTFSQLSSTTGFVWDGAVSTAIRVGKMTINLVYGNRWIETHVGQNDSSRINYGSGTKTLANVISVLRFTTLNGTDTFNFGAVNILVKG